MAELLSGSGRLLARKITFFIAGIAEDLRTMKKTHACAAAFAMLTAVAAPLRADAAGYRLVGWNNLGMHCMDADFSLMSLLPPFNTIQAQLIDPSGNLVTAPGAITVTYEATFDPDGSINSTSAGKTNFWDHVNALFGASVPIDSGLGGFDMPGPANTARAMSFDPATSDFIATGIPITPYDDAGHKNTYPMMRLVARDGSGTVLATTRIVLPVSDEMSCKSCHSSGSSSEAEPAAGWANDADPERDVRLNILRLHDSRQAGVARMVSALAEVGFNPSGLEATAVNDGHAILCATCHLSEALPGSGLAGIKPLTQAMHTSMASATDPATGMKLDDVANRSACYTCHPGSKTRCLRGAMGAAVAADGTMAMQCQSCHGRMTDVGAATRTGWLNEPRCDSCHTGTAIHNSGQIRYTSVMRADGTVRQAVDDTFATNDDTPAAGLSLYRFSRGHGGLECSACHGSTHAEFPSSHDSDNIQSVALQGHEGVLSECTTCHATVPSTVTGGPHGLHPIGASWVGSHGDVAESTGTAACRSCHGSDYRGTVLSRAQADRTFTTDFGTKKFWRGSQIGCYACHAGPGSESASRNRAAVVANAEASTTPSEPAPIALAASDADGDALTLRVVSQPKHGTAGLLNREARYYPDGSFIGDDTFTYAAWDGSIDSNLATVTVHVGTSPCAPECVLPGGGCDPACVPAVTRDAFVVAPKPVHARISRGATGAKKSVSISVKNADASGSGAFRIDVLDGDCPVGTVSSAAFAGGSATAMLSAGQSATATVNLDLSTAAFATPASRAPARCRLALHASPVDAADPVPSNNDAILELSVLDQNDLEPGVEDVFAGSLGPVTIDLAAGAGDSTRIRKPKLVLDAPADGEPVEVTATADDGTCPPGTVGTVDLDPNAAGEQDTIVLAPRAKVRGKLRVTASAAAFSTPASAIRCAAMVSLTYSGPGGDVSNDTTEFEVTVTDAND